MWRATHLVSRYIENNFVPFLPTDWKSNEKARARGGEGEEFQGSRILLKKAFVFPLPLSSLPTYTVFGIYIARIACRGSIVLYFDGGREKQRADISARRERERSRNDTFAAKLKATQVGLQGGLEAAVGSVVGTQARGTPDILFGSFHATRSIKMEAPDRITPENIASTKNASEGINSVEWVHWFG